MTLCRACDATWLILCCKISAAALVPWGHRGREGLAVVLVFTLGDHRIIWLTTSFLSISICGICQLPTLVSGAYGLPISGGVHVAAWWRFVCEATDLSLSFWPRTFLTQRVRVFCVNNSTDCLLLLFLCNLLCAVFLRHDVTRETRSDSDLGWKSSNMD